jgi:hypothetical protein
LVANISYNNASEDPVRKDGQYEGQDDGNEDHHDTADGTAEWSDPDGAHPRWIPTGRDATLRFSDVRR